MVFSASFSSSSVTVSTLVRTAETVREGKEEISFLGVTEKMGREKGMRVGWCLGMIVWFKVQLGRTHVPIFTELIIWCVCFSDLIHLVRYIEFFQLGFSLILVRRLPILINASVQMQCILFYF